VVASLVGDLCAAGVAVRTGTAYLGRRGAEIRTSAGAISAGYVINAAGLYADWIARDFGFAERYGIVPFRGGYRRASPEAPGFRTHIYPAPDLRYPFLGVHIIRTVAGGAKIGPTATPAFWREHYEAWDRFSLPECLAILRVELGLVIRNNCGFRRLAVRELLRSNRRALLDAAQALAAGIRAADFRASGTPGIRAQLVDLRRRTLEMDFRWEGDDRSFHLLNAVSPAFTCALPFSAYLVDRIEELVGSRHAPHADDQAAAHRA
jgi:L-2-hydroxyglutarate oxidase LhgO